MTGHGESFSNDGTERCPYPLTADEARRRVALGAARLDVTSPGWHARVDVGVLDMARPRCCVVGQLREPGEDWPWVAARLLTRERGGIVAHGADLNELMVLACYAEGRSECEVWGPLQDAWAEAIAARRHPVEEPAAVPEAVPADAMLEARRA